MPTTPVHALRYPLATDPADVPSDLQKLASDVDVLLLPCDTVVVAATRIIRNLLLAGDANAAWQVRGDGRMQWGAGGANALDTNLYRSAVGRVMTDNQLAANGGSLGSPKMLVFANLADANATWFVGTDGRMWWGPGGATLGDVELWRPSATMMAWVGTSSMRLKLEGQTDHTQLIFQHDDVNANGRNWAIVSRYFDYGQVDIMVSNAPNNDPVTAGSAVLTMMRNGMLTAQAGLLCKGTAHGTGTAATTAIPAGRGNLGGDVRNHHTASYLGTAADGTFTWSDSIPMIQWGQYPACSVGSGSDCAVGVTATSLTAFSGRSWQNGGPTSLYVYFASFGV